MLRLMPNVPGRRAKLWWHPFECRDYRCEFLGIDRDHQDGHLDDHDLTCSSETGVRRAPASRTSSNCANAPKT